MMHTPRLRPLQLRRHNAHAAFFLFLLVLVGVTCVRAESWDETYARYTAGQIESINAHLDVWCPPPKFGAQNQTSLYHRNLNPLDYPDVPESIRTGYTELAVWNECVLLPTDVTFMTNCAFNCTSGFYAWSGTAVTNSVFNNRLSPYTECHYSADQIVLYKATHMSEFPFMDLWLPNVKPECRRCPAGTSSNRGARYIAECNLCQLPNVFPYDAGTCVASGVLSIDGSCSTRCAQGFYSDTPPLSYQCKQTQATYTEQNVVSAQDPPVTLSSTTTGVCKPCVFYDAATADPMKLGAAACGTAAVCAITNAPLANGDLGSCSSLSVPANAGSCNVRCNQGFYSSSSTGLKCSSGEQLTLPTCMPCPTSCTTQSTGATDSSQCNVCVAPYLQLPADQRPAFSSAGTCGSSLQSGESCDIQCDAGYYRTGSTFTCGASCGSAALTQSCKSCPSGSSSLPGATSSEDCNICQPNKQDPVVPPGMCDLRLIPSSACGSRRTITFLTCSNTTFLPYTSCWARVSGWTHPFYEEWGCSAGSDVPYLMQQASEADFNVSSVGWYCHYGGCFSSSPVLDLSDAALTATNEYWRRSFPLAQLPARMPFPTFRFSSDEFNFFLSSGFDVALQRNSLGYFKQLVAAQSNPTNDQVKVMTLVESWIQDRLAARSFLHTVIEPSIMQMLNARIAITNTVYDLAEKASLRKFQAEVVDSINAIRDAINAMKPSVSTFDIVMSVVSAAIAIASPALGIAEKAAEGLAASALSSVIKSAGEQVKLVSNVIKLEGTLEHIDKTIPNGPKKLETEVEAIFPDFYASAEEMAASINAAAGFVDFGENATLPSEFLETMHARHGLGIINSVFRVTQMLVQFQSNPNLAHTDSAVSALFDGIAPQLTSAQAFLSSIANSSASSVASEVRREHFIDSILLLQETLESVFSNLESSVMKHYGLARELAKLHSFDTAAWLDADAIAWTRFLLINFINDNYSFKVGWQKFSFKCAVERNSQSTWIGVEDYWFYGVSSVSKHSALNYYSDEMFEFRQLVRKAFNGSEFSFLYQNRQTWDKLPPVVWDQQDSFNPPVPRASSSFFQSKGSSTCQTNEGMLSWPEGAIPLHSCMQGRMIHTGDGLPWVMVSNSTFRPDAPFVALVGQPDQYFCHGATSPTLTEWYTYDGFPASSITADTITRLEGTGMWNEMLVDGIGAVSINFTALTPDQELSLRSVVFGSFNLSNLVNADLPSTIVRSRRLVQDAIPAGESLVATPPIPDFATISVDIAAFSVAFASELAVALQLPLASVSVTSVSLDGVYPSLISYVIFPTSSNATVADVQTQLKSLIADPLSSLYAGPLGHCITDADSAIKSLTVTEAALSTGSNPLSVFPSATEANQAVFQPTIMTQFTDSVVQAGKDAAQATAAVAAQTSVKIAEQVSQLSSYQVCGYEVLSGPLPTVETPFLISRLEAAVPGPDSDLASSVIAVSVDYRTDSASNSDSSQSVFSAAVVTLYPPHFSKREFYLPYLSVEPPLTMRTFSNVKLTKQLTRVWTERVMCRELDGPQWRTVHDSAFTELKFGRFTRLLVSYQQTTLVNGWLNFTASDADSSPPLPLGLPVAVASSSVHEEVFVCDLISRAIIRINTTSNTIDESFVLPFAQPFAVALVRNATVLYVLSADRDDASYLYRVFLDFTVATQSRSARLDPCFRVLLRAPLAMALSPDERFMYVSDKQSGFIRRVDLTSTNPNPVDPHFRLVGYMSLVALQTVEGDGAFHFLVVSMEDNVVRKLRVRADSSVSTDMTLNVTASSNFTTRTAISIHSPSPTQIADSTTKQAGLEVYLFGSESASNQIWQLPLSGPSIQLNRTLLCSQLPNGTAATNSFGSSSSSTGGSSSTPTFVDENVDFFDSDNSTDTFSYPSNSTVGNSTDPLGDDGDDEDESVELTDSASQAVYAQYPDNCCSYAFHRSNLPTYSLPAIVGVSSTASRVLTLRNDYLMLRGSDPQAVRCVALGAYVWSTKSSTYQSQYVDSTNGHSFSYKDFFTVSPDGTRVMVSAMHAQHAAMRTYLLSGTLLRLNVSCTLVSQKHYTSPSASLFNQPCVQVFLGNRFQLQSRVLRTRQCGKTKSWYSPSFHRRLLEAQGSEAFAVSSDRMAMCPNGLPSWATCVVNSSKGFTQIPAARVVLSVRLSDQCLMAVSGRSLANITGETQSQLGRSLGVQTQRIALQQMQVFRHSQTKRMSRAAAATSPSASANFTDSVELQFQAVFLPSNDTSDVDPAGLAQYLVASLDDSDAYGSSPTNPFAAPAFISGAASYGTVDSIPVQACQSNQAAAVNGFNSAVDCSAADGSSVTFSDPSTAALTVDGNVATDVSSSIGAADAGIHESRSSWLIPTVVVVSLIALCLVILAVVYFKRSAAVSRVVTLSSTLPAVTKVAPSPLTEGPLVHSDSSVLESAGALSTDGSSHSAPRPVEADVPGLSPSRSLQPSASPESPAVDRPSTATNAFASFFRSSHTVYQPTARRLLPLPTPFSTNSISTAAVDTESKA